MEEGAEEEGDKDEEDGGKKESLGGEQSGVAETNEDHAGASRHPRVEQCGESGKDREIH